MLDTVGFATATATSSTWVLADSARGYTQPPHCDAGDRPQETDMFIITSGPVFRFKDKNAWDRWKQKKGIAFRDGPGSESEHTEGERTKREDERENILEVDHGQGEKHSETTKERETQSDDEDAKREARRVQRETQIRRTILDAVR